MNKIDKIKKISDDKLGGGEIFVKVKNFPTKN